MNHAEAGERATIHTRRTTTARDRARRGDETECLVRERELKALTRARRGTRAPGRVRCPPARPRAASPGDAARDPWRAGRRYSIRLISLQWASRDTRRTDIVVQVHPIARPHRYVQCGAHTRSPVPASRDLAGAATLSGARCPVRRGCGGARARRVSAEPLTLPRRSPTQTP